VSRFNVPPLAALRGGATSSIVAVVVFLVSACTTTAPVPRPTEVLKGVASWYGEEFAGRTTANGEIFDPLQLTAAHRTLPFGTVLEVTNPATKQTVRVRVNDRGPYVGNRLIDLSYAAAEKISLVEPGTGTVDIKVVSIGKGDREPPAPFEVAIDQPKDKIAIPPSEPPAVAFPLPSETRVASPENDFIVSVTEEQRGVPTRRQVAADGTTIENVPISGETAPAALPAAPGHSPAAALDRNTRRPEPAAAKSAPRFVVQVGAFSVEANAKALQDRVIRIGQQAWIDHEMLYRVRIGPFGTRDQAAAARGMLEANGMSAIIVAE
jgi:rare lipoprotein A